MGRHNLYKWVSFRSASTRNRYSVPTEHANSAISVRMYHDHIAVVADGQRVARHSRSFERSQTFYDWQHYISLVERKPAPRANMT